MQRFRLTRWAAAGTAIANVTIAAAFAARSVALPCIRRLCTHLLCKLPLFLAVGICCYLPNTVTVECLYRVRQFATGL